METDEISIYAKSDHHYLGLIGEFVRTSRIVQNKTQENLAKHAGVNRSTVVQLEKGKPVSLISLIQLLRALNRLDVLNEMEVKPVISPLKYAAMQIKIRKRVSKKAGQNLKAEEKEW